MSASGSDPQALEQESQAVERVMRRAQEMGLDPQRVATALDHHGRAPIEYQEVEEVRPRPWLQRSPVKRLVRRSERT